MRSVPITQCVICKVSVLFSALYAKCPYYLVLFMQSVRIIQCFTCKAGDSTGRGEGFVTLSLSVAASVLGRMRMVWSGSCRAFCCAVAHDDPQTFFDAMLATKPEYPLILTGLSCRGLRVASAPGRVSH